MATDGERAGDGSSGTDGDSARDARDARARVARRRAAGSADRILAAAKVLFLESGYDGVNLERIAERAGVSRQTVYNRFGSKEAVFKATVSQHWSAFRAHSDVARLTGEDAPAAEPADVLRGFAAAVMRFAEESEQIPFTRLVIAESRRLTWIAEDFYRLGKEPVLTSFVRSLDALVASGRLDCRDTTLAAHQFLGLIQEFTVWPKVMAIGDAAQPAHSAELVTEEAVAMFLSRYGS